MAEMCIPLKNKRSDSLLINSSGEAEDVNEWKGFMDRLGTLVQKETRSNLWLALGERSNLAS